MEFLELVHRLEGARAHRGGDRQVRSTEDGNGRAGTDRSEGGAARSMAPTRKALQALARPRQVYYYLLPIILHID